MALLYNSKGYADKNFSATRLCWSKGIGGGDAFMKLCLPSSGRETRPAKGEPAQAGSKPCADSVVSLQRAGKYQRPVWWPSQGQKGIGERAIMASQWSSPPWQRPRRRPCRRTSPPQAPSPRCFPPLGLLAPLLAAATAARGRGASHGTSRHGPSIPPPSPASAAATAWPTLSRSLAQGVVYL